MAGSVPAILFVRAATSCTRSGGEVSASLESFPIGRIDLREVIAAKLRDGLPMNANSVRDAFIAHLGTRLDVMEVNRAELPTQARKLQELVAARSWRFKFPLFRTMFESGPFSRAFFVVRRVLANGLLIDRRGHPDERHATVSW